MSTFTSGSTTLNETPFTVRDLARITGLSDPSVRKGIERGELPGYKVGERYVIPAVLFRRFEAGDWTPRPHAAPTPTPEPMVKARAS